MIGSSREPCVSPGAVALYLLVQCLGNCDNRTAENRAAGPAEQGWAGNPCESLPVSKSSKCKAPRPLWLEQSEG